MGDVTVGPEFDIWAVEAQIYTWFAYLLVGFLHIYFQISGSVRVWHFVENWLAVWSCRSQPNLPKQPVHHQLQRCWTSSNGGWPENHRAAAVLWCTTASAVSFFLSLTEPSPTAPKGGGLTQHTTSLFGGAADWPLHGSLGKRCVASVLTHVLLGPFREDPQRGVSNHSVYLLAFTTSIDCTHVQSGCY